ncbi:MAG: hypothetical protein MRZ07_02060, partial [Sutterella sp.]|nr:hypothetical protein [Sutterella sp.]
IWPPAAAELRSRLSRHTSRISRRRAKQNRAAYIAALKNGALRRNLVRGDSAPYSFQFEEEDATCLGFVLRGKGNGRMRFLKGALQGGKLQGFSACR